MLPALPVHQKNSISGIQHLTTCILDMVYAVIVATCNENGNRSTLHLASRGLKACQLRRPDAHMVITDSSIDQGQIILCEGWLWLTWLGMGLLRFTVLAFCTNTA